MFSTHYERTIKLIIFMNTIFFNCFQEKKYQVHGTNFEGLLQSFAIVMLSFVHLKPLDEAKNSSL